VVVSDASELLFEDIKKLNAQQRPDVPTCLIYAPISRFPCPRNTSTFPPSFLFFHSHTAHAKRGTGFFFFFTVCGAIEQIFPVFFRPRSPAVWSFNDGSRCRVRGTGEMCGRRCLGEAKGKKKSVYATVKVLKESKRNPV